MGPSLDLMRAVGKQVKLLRERAGLTQKELGDRLGYSEDLVSSLERGRRTPQREFLEAADEALGAEGMLRATIEDVECAKAKARVRHPAWFQDDARLESGAVEINFFSMVTVPGLTQTEDYARVTFTVRQPLWADDIVEQRVAARMARQEIVTRWPPPLVTAVILQGPRQSPTRFPRLGVDRVRTVRLRALTAARRSRRGRKRGARERCR